MASTLEDVVVQILVDLYVGLRPQACKMPRDEHVEVLCCVNAFDFQMVRAINRCKFRFSVNSIFNDSNILRPVD